MHTVIQTRLETLRKLLGVQYPIMLAPMAGVSGGRLASAVSEAGGLGLIGGGYGDEVWLTHQIEECKDRHFGVGFIAWALAKQPRLLDLALDRGARVILLSFGSQSVFAPIVKRRNATLVAQIQTINQAREAVAEGADLIVAQGSEAGGHGGHRGTMSLVPAVVDAVAPIPVLAAGGIADGRGLAAALMLGAHGVVCGTAFYSAEESLAPLKAKHLVVNACGDDTVKSPTFDLVRGPDWPDGPWSLRTLQNDFSRQWSADIEGLQKNLLHEQQRYRDALKEEDFNVAAVIAGEAVDLVHRIAPASSIVHSIVKTCEVTLGASLFRENACA